MRIAPLRPIAPGKPVHSLEVELDDAWGMKTTVKALRAFYGRQTPDFLDWLAELYWRSRENVLPKRPKDTRKVMNCGVVPTKRDPRSGVAPVAAAWLLELIFTTGKERPEFAGQIGTVAGPVPNTRMLRGLAAELGHFTAWLHSHGVRVAFKKAAEYNHRRIGFAVGMISRETGKEKDER